MNRNTKLPFIIYLLSLTIVSTLIIATTLGNSVSAEQVVMPAYNEAMWSSLDCSFGINGIAVDPEVDSTYSPMDVAVQSDGRILVTGFFETSGVQRGFLRRYNANGTLDRSFGSNGSLRLPVTRSLTHERGERLAIMRNGKIAVFGMVEGADQFFPVI